MIFLVQFEINKHLYIFSQKIYSCLFVPNCTRNHLITYTYILTWDMRHCHYLNNEDQLKSHHNKTSNIITDVRPQLAYWYTLA